MRSDPEGIADDSEAQKVTWRDAAGRERSLTLSGYLHQYDLSFLQGRSFVAGSANDDAYGHPGFGYVVSHNTETGNSPLGKANVPTAVSTRVFSGGHHAIHRVELVYDRDKEGGGRGLKIPVVIDWFVATGRDHPVWAVTWKLDQLSNPQGVDLNAYRMDTRGPYGSLNFDGSPNKGGEAIGGVAWGDSQYAFNTSAALLTLNAAWTYDQPNTVNFVRAWTETSNTEMGIVQTREGDKELGYGERVVGRERGSTSAKAYLNKGDCTGVGDPRNYSMPCISGWPYQMMNYDWDPNSTAKPADSTGTKLMGWGSAYGYLGASSFDLFDYSGMGDGRGERSYGTFIVLGPKCNYGAGAACDEPGSVQQTLKHVEALGAATVSEVQTGMLATELPRGPGASSTRQVVNGYNDSYAAFYLRAAQNRVTFKFAPTAGQPVERPIFVVQGYGAALPKVSVDGVAVTVNTGDMQSGAFVSLDQASKELWITLNRSVAAPIAVSIEP